MTFAIMGKSEKQPLCFYFSLTKVRCVYLIFSNHWEPLNEYGIMKKNNGKSAANKKCESDYDS